MKKSILLLFAFAICSCGTKRLYLDETGKEISYNEYLNLLDDIDNPITGWDYINDSNIRVTQIVKPVYTPLIVRYPVLKKKIEEITGRKFEDKIFLITYNYLNDLCTEKDNKFSKLDIANWKYRIHSDKMDIETRNKEIVILEFFEEGYILENSPESPDEYFFKDTGNFLRESIFRTPASCGSFALIKPNGTALVKNGEDYLLRIEQLLKPENWNQLFME